MVRADAVSIETAWGLWAAPPATVWRTQMRSMFLETASELG